MVQVARLRFHVKQPGHHFTLRLQGLHLRRRAHAVGRVVVGVQLAQAHHAAVGLRQVEHLAWRRRGRHRRRRSMKSMRLTASLCSRT
jgi:hypothetical protein